MRQFQRRLRIASRGFAVTLLLAAPAAGVRAQDPPPDGWHFRGELTAVASAGNAETLTFGLGSLLENRQGRNLLKLEAGGMRTESVLRSRVAIGSPSDYTILDDENREKSAEAYFARARYDRALGERLFAFGGVDWLRNTFAGIDSRTLLALGGGNIWQDQEAVRFRTDYALTWTFQSDVVENPFVDQNFPGVRAGWEYWRRLTGTTEFDSRLVGDLNLNETDDVRADFTNSVSVAISSALALKPSLQILWRNQPSLTEVPLFASGGEPLGQNVTTPLDKTDMLFRLALVVKL